MFQEEKKEIYGAETLYREMGYYMSNKKKYRRSLSHFDKAIEVTPFDFRALFGRSYARAKTCYFKCALDDINKCLVVFPDDLRAEQQKAYFTFLNTDFEKAFLLNQRGLPRRQKPDIFLIGTMECSEEVERTIGKRGGHPLRDHFGMIRTIAWKKALVLRKGQQWKPRLMKRRRKQKKFDNTPVLYINFMKKLKRLQGKSSELSILESLSEDKTHEYTSQIPFLRTMHKPQQKRTSNIDNVMAEKYLDKMCFDKKFLKDLKTDPRIYSPNIEGSKRINILSRQGFKDVSARQELLRVRQPFYSIKYNEILSQGALLARQNANLMRVQDVVRHDVDTFLKHLRKARDAYQTKICLRIANNLKSYIDKKPLKLLPNKEMYLEQMYEIIGLVNLDCFRLSDTMSPEETDKRINFLFGLPISREPSTDSVIRENKKEFESIKKTILDTEVRLAAATTPLETVWLYYDLARDNIKLKKWDLSRFYARKSLNMAQCLKNHVWETNVQLLITKSLVLQRNRNEAKNELKRTREIALQLKYEEIIKFIDKAGKIIENIDFEDISTEKVVNEREKQIVRVILKQHIQDEVRHLFEMMDAIPGNRRMPIMPGITLEDKKGPSRKSSAIKPSIKPKSAIDAEFQAQLAKRGMELLDEDD